MKRWAVAIGAAALLVVALFMWRVRQDSPAIVASFTPSSAQAATPPAPITTTQPTAEGTSAPAELKPVDRAAPTPSPSVIAPTEILVRGTVRDGAGQPVPDAGLRWIDDRGLERFVEFREGAYSLAGLQPGHFLVEILGSGWRREQLDVDLLAQPPVQEFNFTAHANPQILIRLASTDGRPLIGIENYEPLPGNQLRPYVSSHAPRTVLDPEVVRTRGRSDYGEFRDRWELERQHIALPSDALGILYLMADPPLQVSLLSGAGVVDSRALESLPKEIVFSLAGTELRAKLASVRVRLLQTDEKAPAQNGMLMLHGGSSINANTDKEGRATIHGLLSGSYYLTLRARQSAPQSRTLALEPGQELDLGDIALAPFVAQPVRFVSEGSTGAPVRCVMRPEAPGDLLGTLGSFDNITLGGAIGNTTQMPFPGAGSFVLRVTAVGEHSSDEALHLGARPMRCVFGNEPVGEIVVRIEPTRDVALRPHREATGTSNWLIATADGLPCQRVRIEGRAPKRIELVPGEYTIALVDPQTNALGHAQAFTVGNEFLTLELGP